VGWPTSGEKANLHEEATIWCQEASVKADPATFVCQYNTSSDGLRHPMTTGHRY